MNDSSSFKNPAYWSISDLLFGSRRNYMYDKTRRENVRSRMRERCRSEDREQRQEPIVLSFGHTSSRCYVTIVYPNLLPPPAVLYCHFDAHCAVFLPLMGGHN